MQYRCVGRPNHISVPKSRDLSRTPRFWAWSPWLNFAARDKSREPKSPWFWEISPKNEKIPYFCPKSYNFCQKNTKNSHSNLQTKTFSKKVRDFSKILRSFACDFRDFGGVFLFVIFVIFWLKSRDFQEKSFGNTGRHIVWMYGFVDILIFEKYLWKLWLKISSLIFKIFIVSPPNQF